jgi:hypothetical protein
VRKLEEAFIIYAHSLGIQLIQIFFFQEEDFTPVEYTKLPCVLDDLSQPRIWFSADIRVLTAETSRFKAKDFSFDQENKATSSAVRKGIDES